LVRGKQALEQDQQPNRMGRQRMGRVMTGASSKRMRSDCGARRWVLSGSRHFCFGVADAQTRTPRVLTMIPNCDRFVHHICGLASGSQILTPRSWSQTAFFCRASLSTVAWIFPTIFALYRLHRLNLNRSRPPLNAATICHAMAPYFWNALGNMHLRLTVLRNTLSSLGSRAANADIRGENSSASRF